MVAAENVAKQSRMTLEIKKRKQETAETRTEFSEDFRQTVVLREVQESI